MRHRNGKSTWALALLATTFLTPPGPIHAAPGDTLGPEFQVNSFTPDYQALPSVAMDADGDFVVAWQSYDQDGGYDGGYGIFAQRYDAAGVAQGPEFQVNSSWLFWQDYPSVAMDADGDFVVAWQSDDGSPTSIYAQRYDAAGVAQGPEFQVNSFTAGTQWFPSVAMDADGDFVVAWQEGDGDGWGVFARRFDAAGMAQGAQFLVNTHTTHAQETPAVAMNADGDFVVAWQSVFQDGHSEGIFAQRFDATGAAQGGEFLVNTHTTAVQVNPTVAMDADGDFVVAWQSGGGQDGDGWGVFAQRFDAAGVAQGPEFQVNTFTTSSQRTPTVAMDVDGDFVVAWESWNQDGSQGGIFAQRFDATGVAQGSEFRVNNTTTFNQALPSVAKDADGDFVVAWTDHDGPLRLDFKDVFAQRHQGDGPVAGDFTVDGRSDILWRNTGDGAAAVWQMDGFLVAGHRTIGAPAADWQVVGMADFNADTKADMLWRNTVTGAAAIWQMDGLSLAEGRTVGTPALVWRVVGTGDFDGDDHADILWRNSETGNTVIWRMKGFARKDGRSIGSPPLDWAVAGVGDFDADAKSDILWRNTATGQTAIWLMDGLALAGHRTIGQPDLDWQVQDLADFDADAKSDILWRHGPSGNTVVWKMNGLAMDAGRSIGTPPLAWRIVGTGDTDGDRKSDILWRHTGTGDTVIWRMDGFALVGHGSIGKPPLVWEVQ